jgi:hypothetical protein
MEGSSARYARRACSFESTESLVQALLVTAIKKKKARMVI